MSDTEASQSEPKSTVNDKKKREEDVAAPTAEKKCDDDEVKVKDEPEDQNKRRDETDAGEKTKYEAGQNESEVIVLLDESSPSKIEDMVTETGSAPPGEPPNKPHQRNREPSEELEYEPLPDEQAAEGDAEQQKEGQISLSGVQDELGDRDNSVMQSENPPEESSEEIHFQRVSDRRQIFEVPIIPSTSLKPVLCRKDQQEFASGKRQVSWESKVESISVEQSKHTHKSDKMTPQVSAYNDWEQTTSQPFTASRYAYSVAPSAISQPGEQFVSQATDQLATVSMSAGYPSPRGAKPFQSALYRRTPVTQLPDQRPFYVRPNFCITPHSAPGTPSPASIRATVEPWNNYPNQAKSMSAQPPPSQSVSDPISPQLSAAALDQKHGLAVGRKVSGNSIYVGSQVIATETGPSLTVPLRRPTSERHWGFTFFGGAENGCPPFVNKVSFLGLTDSKPTRCDFLP